VVAVPIPRFLGLLSGGGSCARARRCSRDGGGLGGGLGPAAAAHGGAEVEAEHHARPSSGSTRTRHVCACDQIRRRGEKTRGPHVWMRPRLRRSAARRRSDSRRRSASHWSCSSRAAAASSSLLARWFLTGCGVRSSCSPEPSKMCGAHGCVAVFSECGAEVSGDNLRKLSLERLSPSAHILFSQSFSFPPNLWELGS
jgi:hypothetical protein